MASVSVWPITLTGLSSLVSNSEMIVRRGVAPGSSVAAPLGTFIHPVPGELVLSHDRHARLARLLELWPARFPLTLEFQHEASHVDETFDLLRGHGAALCATDLDELAEPPIIRLTGPFLYLRLRRTTYAHDDTGISPGRALALAERL